jgi:kinetochore protein Nuf2
MMRPRHGKRGATPKPRHNKPVGYSYPILGYKTVMECLPQMLPGLNIEVSDLKKPTQTLVRRVYEGFAELLMGVTKEELNQPVFAGLGELSNPELHEESIPRLALLRKTQTLLSACGYKTFQLKDLLAPEADAFRNQLSAVINMAKYREERVEDFDAYDEQAAEYGEILDGAEDACEAAGEAVKRLEAERAAEAPRIAELTSEVSAEDARIKTMNRAQADKQESNAELKREKKRWEARVEELKFRINGAADECRALEGRIVHDPALLRAEIARLQEDAGRERAAIADLTRRRRDLELRETSVERSRAEVAGAMELVAQIAEEQAKCRGTAKQRQAKRLRANEQRAQIQSEEQMAAHLRRQLDRFGERSAKARENLSLKVEAACTLWQETEEQLRTMKERQHREAMAVRQLQEQVDIVRHEHAAEDAVRSQALEARKQAYAGLMAKVERYDRQLLAATAAAAAAPAAGGAATGKKDEREKENCGA